MENLYSFLHAKFLNLRPNSSVHHQRVEGKFVILNRERINELTSSQKK
jgi:hypothetical protein